MASNDLVSPNASFGGPDAAELIALQKGDFGTLFMLQGRRQARDAEQLELLRSTNLDRGALQKLGLEATSRDTATKAVASEPIQSRQGSSGRGQVAEFLAQQAGIPNPGGLNKAATGQFGLDLDAVPGVDNAAKATAALGKAGEGGLVPTGPITNPVEAIRGSFEQTGPSVKTTFPGTEGARGSTNTIEGTFDQVRKAMETLAPRRNLGVGDEPPLVPQDDNGINTEQGTDAQRQVLARIKEDLNRLVTVVSQTIDASTGNIILDVEGPVGPERIIIQPDGSFPPRE